MRVSKENLLAELPPYRDEWVTIADRQEVERDIIPEIVQAHKAFAKDYDKIAPFFIGDTLKQTCENLYNFCIDNIRYKEEPEKMQTTALPAGLLTRGYGDCKAYAGFIGGCLGAISRLTGERIDWYYCFASYEIDQRVPYHVFVVVETENGPLWVDPTPGAEGRTPVWEIKERVQGSVGTVEQVASVGSDGLLRYETVGGPVGGTLLPPPSWYPANLPKFYRMEDDVKSIVLRPLMAVPGAAEADVLDTLLYLQMYLGYNRSDTDNALPVAWFYSDTGQNAHNAAAAYTWVKSAFWPDKWGDGSGNFADVSPNARNIDTGLYGQLQARYVQRAGARFPWLSGLQARGGGIDLMSIPRPDDGEIERPEFYPDYLPSLFVSSGGTYNRPAGFMTTKPFIYNFNLAKDKQYIPTATDVAYLMMYAQPVIALGPTPYPVNWYLSDYTNGALAFYNKISLAIGPYSHSAELQTYGIRGDMMSFPDYLHADPYASDFSKAFELVLKSVFSNIPGVGQLYRATMALAAAGGAGITVGELPEASFSREVFQAADAIAAGLTANDSSSYKRELLEFGGLAAGLLLLWWLFED